MVQYSVSGTHNPQATSWTVPELIAQANTLAEKHGSCVILLDDFHRLNKSTEAIMYEFLLERKLQDYKLHPKVAIVCAQNISEESGANIMSEPIKDRLKLLHIKFDFTNWFNLFGKFAHPYIASFLKVNPLFANEDETVSLTANATPRSWMYFSEELQEYSKEFIVENAVALAGQYTSNQCAADFHKHVMYMETIDFTSVVSQQKLVNIDDLEILDQILWAYILNYVTTPTDAAYIIELMNMNTKSISFIGYIVSEFSTKYQLRELNKSITDGQSILIDKLMSTYDSSNYTLTPKEKTTLNKLDFENKNDLLATVSEYLL